jgi:hypothetical protein
MGIVRQLIKKVSGIEFYRNVYSSLGSDTASQTNRRTLLSEILGFRTVSIALIIKKQTEEQHDVSETGSVSVLR